MVSTSVDVEVLALTPRELAAAFTEWERRYREEPARFLGDATRHAHRCEDLGEQQAAYLIEILADLRANEAG